MKQKNNFFKQNFSKAFLYLYTTSLQKILFFPFVRNMTTLKTHDRSQKPYIDYYNSVKNQRFFVQSSKMIKRPTKKTTFADSTTDTRRPIIHAQVAFADA